MKQSTSDSADADAHFYKKEPVSDRMQAFLGSCMNELSVAHYELRALGALVRNPSDCYQEADDVIGLGIMLTNMSKRLWVLSRDIESAQMGTPPARV